MTTMLLSLLFYSVINVFVPAVNEYEDQ